MKKIINRIFALFFAVIIFLWIIWNPIWDEVTTHFVSSLGYPLSIFWISTPDVNFFNFFNLFLFIIVFGLLYEVYRPTLNFEFNKNKKWTAAGIFLIAISIIVIISIMFLEIDEPGQSIFVDRTFVYPSGSVQIHVWPNLLWEFLSVFCMETVSLSLLFGILFMTKSTPQKSKSYKIMLIGAIVLELFIFIAFYLKFFITGQGESIYSGYTRIKLLQQYWFHWDFWSELVILISAIWLLKKGKEYAPQIPWTPQEKRFVSIFIVLVLFIIFVAVPLAEGAGLGKVFISLIMFALAMAVFILYLKYIKKRKRKNENKYTTKQT